MESRGSTLSLLFLLATTGLICPDLECQAIGWTQLHQAWPAARNDFAMAYDAGRNQVVLFGGRTSTGGTGDTWIWDGKSWTLAHPTRSPVIRVEHAMAYDAARKQVVLFGGRVTTGAAADTWLWDGNDWTQASTSTSPSPRIQHAMAYDEGSKQVILFGGGYGNINSETWAWNGKTWTQFKPTNPPRSVMLEKYSRS